MSYGGVGMQPGKYALTDKTFGFLKSALMKVTPDLPYRGPRKYQEGSWVYEMDVRGNPDEYDGGERIFEDGVLVFSQTFSGGIVIHKSPDREPVYPWDR